MSNISFKALIYGLNNKALKQEFEKETEEDTQHSISIKQDKDTGLDIFVLTKNGEQTVRHLNATYLKRDSGYTINQLIKIFNILKIREAMNTVTKKKRNKINNDFNEDLQKIIEAEKKQQI